MMRVAKQCRRDDRRRPEPDPGSERVEQVTACAKFLAQSYKSKYESPHAGPLPQGGSVQSETFKMKHADQAHRQYQNSCGSEADRGALPEPRRKHLARRQAVV